MPRGDFGVARNTAHKASAFFEKTWTGSFVNCAIHSSTAHERSIRSIDDYIDCKFCNIASPNTVITMRKENIYHIEILLFSSLDGGYLSDGRTRQ
jgi:hypothetical protein